MIIGKRKTKLANGIVAIEKVSKYEYKSLKKITYFYSVELKKKDVYICDSEEKIDAEKAIKLLKEFGIEERLINE